MILVRDKLNSIHNPAPHDAWRVYCTSVLVLKDVATRGEGTTTPVYRTAGRIFESTMPSRVVLMT